MYGTIRALGTSCIDVYSLINICIPTLAKEVVKKSQKITVKNPLTAVKDFFVGLFTPADNAGFVPAFA